MPDTMAGPWKVYSARHERLLGHLRTALRLDRDGRPESFAIVQWPGPTLAWWERDPPDMPIIPVDKWFSWDERLGGFVAPEGVYWSRLDGFEPL